MLWGSAVNLPFALRINSFRTSGLILKFALCSLSINYYSIICCAGSFQDTTIGVLAIVVHAIAERDDTFRTGGSQLDFATIAISA